MQQEVCLAESKELSASQLKRAVILSRGSARLKVEPDGSVSSLYTSSVRRLVFGREQLGVFRVQAGFLIPQRPKDTRVRISPGAVEFWPAETHESTQSVSLLGTASTGYSRSVVLSNRADAPTRLRIVSLHDPTTMNFRRERDAPGEIGVNAFNRGDHVVMDDVGDTTGVRVIGFSPRPSAIFMTKDRQRALDLMGSRELLDSVAGMSGAIMILTQWEVDLPPGGRAELRTTSLYHPSSLEAALADLGAATRNGGEPTAPSPGPVFRCSSPSYNFAFGWARAAMEAIEGEEDRLDRLGVGFALQVLRPSFYEKEFDSEKLLQGKDGLILHQQYGRGGPLETSLFVISACRYLMVKGDKKLAKKWYPSLRKACKGLAALSKSGLIQSEHAFPEGWRRRLASGFPTGTLSEVNLVATRALTDMAQVAYMIGKGSDSADFRESSVRMTTALNSSLRDAESGNLALNLDASGRLHKELTADQVVALSYNLLDHNLASSMVHRLLEADFETGYGPRTVPSTNALYYSPTYGEGQLGGYWTRAALSHALLAFRSGYPSIGGLQLEKVARLISTDAEKLGGVPGEFPYWVDGDKKAIGGSGSDPVAASRFLEALLVGELGLGGAGKDLKIAPPSGSKLQWLMIHDADLGGRGSFFLGRAPKWSFSASTFDSVDAGEARKFAQTERLDAPPPFEGLVFWDDSSMLICLGNGGSNDAAAKLSIPVKAKTLSRSLYVDLDELNPETTAWRRLERVRLLDHLNVRAELKAGAWKWFRIAQITS